MADTVAEDWVKREMIGLSGGTFMRTNKIITAYS